MASSTSLEDETRRFLTILQANGSVNRKDLEVGEGNFSEPFDRRRLADIFNVMSIYTFLRSSSIHRRGSGTVYILQDGHPIDPPIKVRTLLTDLEHNYNVLFCQMLTNLCKKNDVGDQEYYDLIENSLNTIELFSEEKRGNSMKMICEYLDDFARTKSAADLKIVTDYIISQSSAK